MICLPSEPLLLLCASDGQTWSAVVQVRQRNVKHRRTLLYLEQLLLKSGAADKALNIKEASGGLDFYFESKSQASSLVDYLQSVVPIRITQSSRLISLDAQSNTSRSTFTFGVEVAPISRGDLVVLPAKLLMALGGGGGGGLSSAVMLCYRITSAIYLIDPTTLKTVDISAHNYFRFPFTSVMTSKQLSEYTVVDLVPETAPTNTAAEDKKDSKASVMPTGNSKAKKKHGTKSSSTTPAATPKQQPTASPNYTAASAISAATVTVPVAAVSIPDTQPQPQPQSQLQQPAAPMHASVATSGTARERYGAKLGLATATVARTSELGQPNSEVLVLTHLGNVLKIGDTVQGFDVSNAGSIAVILEDPNNGYGKAAKKFRIPDVVLVQKSYPKSQRKNRGNRKFRLKSLKKAAADPNAEDNTDSAVAANESKSKKKSSSKSKPSAAASAAALTEAGEEDDIDLFMDEIERDPEMRRQINLYSNPSVKITRKSAEDNAKDSKSTAAATMVVKAKKAKNGTSKNGGPYSATAASSGGEVEGDGEAGGEEFGVDAAELIDDE